MYQIRTRDPIISDKSDKMWLWKPLKITVQWIVGLMDCKFSITVSVAKLLERYVRDMCAESDRYRWPLLSTLSGTTAEWKIHQENLKSTFNKTWRLLHRITTVALSSLINAVCETGGTSHRPYKITRNSSRVDHGRLQAKFNKYKT